jgi:hypothetical protein
MGAYKGGSAPWCCHNKIDRVICSPQKFISHSCAGWQVLDQASRSFSVPESLFDFLPLTATLLLFPHKVEG